MSRLFLLFLSCSLFVTPWPAAHRASLSFTISQNLLKHIKPSHPLPSPSPSASIFPIIRVFPNESVFHIKWPKYWSFSFSISPSNEYSGLISFRIDWLDPLAVQGTIKSGFQHHGSKASIIWLSAFFSIQLSHTIHDYQKNHSFD